MRKPEFARLRPVPMWSGKQAPSRGLGAPWGTNRRKGWGVHQQRFMLLQVDDGRWFELILEKKPYN